MVIVPRPFPKSRYPKTMYVIVDVKGQRRETTRRTILYVCGDFLFGRGESRVAALRYTSRFVYRTLPPSVGVPILIYPGRFLFSEHSHPALYVPSRFQSCTRYYIHTSHLARCVQYVHCCYNSTLRNLRSLYLLYFVLFKSK